MMKLLNYISKSLIKPNNQFLEQSLIAAASILYEKEDYESSLDYYERLEKVAANDGNKLIALKGQLRSAYQAGDAQKTIIAAGKINSISKYS